MQASLFTLELAMKPRVTENSRGNGGGSKRSHALTWVILLVCVAGALLTQLYFGSLIKSANQSPAVNTYSPPCTTESSKVEQYTKAHLCPKKDVNGMVTNSSKSQSREDQMLLTWFNGLCNGTYIEMGALDGLTFSNSYLFEKQLAWSGVLIELSPSDYEKLKVNRPDNILINAAVCNERKKIHYLTNHKTGTGAVDGIYEFMPESFRSRWWNEVTLENPGNQVKEIDCIPLSELLEKTPYTYFDFYSLDVEGAELEVLKSIDFDKFSFGILFVEADQHNPRKNLALRIFVESKGYIFLMEERRSYWFVNPDFFNIYKELLHD